MIMKIFAVYDSAVSAYMSPFFMHSRGQALRSFCDTAEDVNTNIGKHPKDFTLFELGEYNDSTAGFTLYDCPHALGVALELLSAR